jgi:hypothetical protein
MAEDDGLPPLKPTSFTVSYTFDTHRSGERHNHFVTMAFDLPPGATAELAVAMSIKGSAYVTKAAVLHAVARGQLSQEDAKERLLAMGENHESLLKSARRSLDTSKE